MYSKLVNYSLSICKIEILLGMPFALYFAHMISERSVFLANRSMLPKTKDFIFSFDSKTLKLFKRS